MEKDTVFLAGTLVEKVNSQSSLIPSSFLTVSLSGRLFVISNLSQPADKEATPRSINSFSTFIQSQKKLCGIQ